MLILCYHIWIGLFVYNDIWVSAELSNSQSTFAWTSQHLNLTTFLWDLKKKGRGCNSHFLEMELWYKNWVDCPGLSCVCEQSWLVVFRTGAFLCVQMVHAWGVAPSWQMTCCSWGQGGISSISHRAAFRALLPLWWTENCILLFLMAENKNIDNCGYVFRNCPSPRWGWLSKSAGVASPMMSHLLHAPCFLSLAG